MASLTKRFGDDIRVGTQNTDGAWGSYGWSSVPWDGTMAASDLASEYLQSGNGYYYVFRPPASNVVSFLANSYTDSDLATATTWTDSNLASSTSWV